MLLQFSRASTECMWETVWGKKGETELARSLLYGLHANRRAIERFLQAISRHLQSCLFQPIAPQINEVALFKSIYCGSLYYKGGKLQCFCSS